jgi:hypothetical protein
MLVAAIKTENKLRQVDKLSQTLETYLPSPGTPPLAQEQPPKECFNCLKA